MESLKGRKVLLAGGTGGIGRKLLQLLSASGAVVWVTGTSESKLDQLAAATGHPRTQMAVMDITQEASVEAAVQQVVAAAGSIEVLINTSGIGILKPVDSLTGADFNTTLQVNLAGPFYLIKAILPGMKQQNKGLIIHVPGILGKVPMAGAAAYSASKYGLVGLLQSIREEIKRTNIRITNLFLGGVDTPFWDNIDLRVQRDKMVVAEEAAKAIWFLCQQPDSGVINEMVLQPFNHQAI